MIRADYGQQPVAIRDLYDVLTGDEDARVCRDIPEEACNDQPRNFLLHLLSLAATKIGDGLADAKLTLAWLLAVLGAPAFMTAFLVPIRESLSLLPQLIVATLIRRKPVRKWFWVAGSVAQGCAVLAIAGLTATGIGGTEAGWLLIALLALFSLARGVCSVASKDVLGKTISKTRRGTVTGFATSAAGIVIVGFGIYAQLVSPEPQSRLVLVALLSTAGLLWLIAAVAYSQIEEVPGSTEGGQNALEAAFAHLSLLREDKRLRHFLLTRTLLLSTALSAPFYVVLAQDNTGGELADLGLLIAASGLASALSAPMWGRMADRSSRLVLVVSALLAAICGIVVFAAIFGGAPIIESPYFYASLLFALGLAHSGVRLGRKTYLVDMATADSRSVYVAVSNTLIGIMLLAGGLLGLAAEGVGTTAVILLLSVIALAAAASAWFLDEVQ